jgi:thioredoxin-related protein
MKKLLLLMIFLILVGYSHSSAADGVQWLSLKEGFAKAKLENKPCIVDFFYGKGCPRCEKLQKYVYDDPAISKKINDDFVPIRIDLTKPLTAEEDSLGKKFDYKMDCLLLFLDHNGDLISDNKGKRLCFVDNVDPELFVSYLDEIKKKYENK